MGAVNTTYTFLPTDTITSSKMNNIIDQTTMTSSAVSGSTLQVTPSGQLTVNSQGITSNELAAQAVTQAKVATNVVGNGPCFNAFTYENIALTTNQFYPYDFTLGQAKNSTGFVNRKFIANVPGWYFFTLRLKRNTSDILRQYAPRIQVNGGSSQIDTGASFISSSNIATGTVAVLTYLNGSTDYVEGGAFALSGSTTLTQIGAELNCFLISSP